MPDRVAIIGTRHPDVVQSATAFALANILTASYGIIVRTGGAEGIDMDAMNGALPSLLEVVLPWAKFNRHLIPEGAEIVVANELKHPHWFKSVTTLHPAPRYLSIAARRLIARDYGIVEPVMLTVALPDSMGTGGTAQGLRVSRKLDIPIIQANRHTLDKPDQVLSQVITFLKERSVPIPQGSTVNG